MFAQENENVKWPKMYYQYYSWPKIFVAEICSETSKNEGFGRFWAPRRGEILGSEHICIKPPLVSQHSATRGGLIQGIVRI